ncbi:uncharacterized protein LOC134760462 isoform X2 [Pongo abelii]|uniref:uncharacterized protein LOC134760462 isoform X2 n=1 Tax=Pongo abelii TaxID=9601 RepID=UPI0030074B22
MSQKSTQQILPQGEVGCLLEMQPKFLQFVSLQALSSVFPHNEGDCRKDLDKLPIHFPTPHPRYFSVRQELLALTRLSTYLSLEHEGHWCIHEHAWIKCKQLNCVSRIESTRRISSASRRKQPCLAISLLNFCLLHGPWPDVHRQRIDPNNLIRHCWK